MNKCAHACRYGFDSPKARKRGGVRTARMRWKIPAAIPDSEISGTCPTRFDAAVFEAHAENEHIRTWGAWSNGKPKGQQRSSLERLVGALRRAWDTVAALKAAGND